MKYMLIIAGPEVGERSPEEASASMSAWNDYTKALVDAGAFQAGEGLQPSETATTVAHAAGGERVVSDGPFAETKEQVGGFYLIESADLDEALGWAKRMPVTEGYAIEVRPVMDYPAEYEEPDAQQVAAS